MYMAFSLIAFGIAGFIKIRKNAEQKEFDAKLGRIRNFVTSIDADLGGQFNNSVREIPEQYRASITGHEIVFWGFRELADQARCGASGTLFPPCRHVKLFRSGTDFDTKSFGLLRIAIP